MKRCLLVVFCLVSLLFAISPDKITVETVRKKGFGPISPSCMIAQEMAPDSPWLPTIPKINGVPENKVFFAIEHADFLQYCYQSYYAGTMDENFFKSLQQSWDWHPDTTAYCKKFLSVYIAMAAYYNKDDKLELLIDQNSNYDLSDDKPIQFAEIIPGQRFWDRLAAMEPLLVQYEIFDGKEIVKTDYWIYVDLAPHIISSGVRKDQPLALGFTAAQHRYGDFELNGKPYHVALYNSRAVYRINNKIKIWADGEDIEESISQMDVSMQDMVRIENDYYKYTPSVDGKYITLEKQTDVASYDGSGMLKKITNLQVNTINDKKIELENYKGKYVLLDFWGTWCGPCRGEIPKLKELFTKYAAENFTIIGIAKDDSVTLAKFVAANGIEWPQIIQDEDTSLLKAFNIQSYPTTFLIDPEGTILAKDIRGPELETKLAEIFK